MSKEKKIRLGLMGGTFDPIHYGHLVTAEAARDQYQLDEVIFVPTGNPPHKRDKIISDADDRMMMCILATISNPYFQVSDIEVKREGFSYTYETVQKFLELYDNCCEIFFITGCDAVLEICTWKNVDLLMDNCTIIAASRPGFVLENAEDIFETLKKKVFFMEVPALAISSTDIRQRVRMGNPIKYLLPDAVENYLIKRRLYNKNDKY